MIPALLTRPCRLVSFVRNSFAAATTVGRDMWSISRREMLAFGYSSLMEAMAAVAFVGLRAHI